MIVITRNRPAILAQCLECLDRQSVAAGEIIVIDSSDDFQLLQISNIRHVHFPAGRQQMPKARNEGIRLAGTSHVAFVDDDCLVDQDWLAQLVAAYQSRPELSGVGGRINDPRWHFDPQQPVGRVSADGRVISNFFGDPGGVVDVQILPGGNMSFRRDRLLATGGFDPDYIATNHREDPDLCLRLLQQGDRLAYQPAAKALHLNARNSLGELQRWHEFYLRYSFGRNEAFFLARHFPRVVIRRWITDTVQQSQRAWRAKSVVDGLCSVVHAFSFGVGLLSFMVWGRISRKAAHPPGKSGCEQPELRCGGCLF